MIKENIITFPVSTGSYEKFIDEIIHLSERQESSYVCFANVHMVVEAKNDPAFNKVVQNADIVAPDGKPLAMFLKYFKRIDQERVAGLDVFPDLLKESEIRKKSIFFYGTTDDILEKIVTKARREYPALLIAGTLSPPFRALSPSEEDDIVNTINSAKPDLIFVALGCPKQENWMALHKSKVKGCMLGLGHAFKVYSEISKRSPKWMQKLSLEWAYRLYQEPGRLWKRYFYTNTTFLLLTGRYFLQTLFMSPNSRKSSHVVYKCDYHVLWVPLQRFSMFTPSIEAELRADIKSLCVQHECTVSDIDIHQEYIKLKMSIPPKLSLSVALESVRNKVASNLFKNNESLRNDYPDREFWTKGYFITTDILSTEVIQRFVKRQWHEESEEPRCGPYLNNL